MGMDIFMEFTVRKLFKTDGKISGCFAYDRNDGSLHVFKAKTQNFVGGTHLSECPPRARGARGAEARRAGEALQGREWGRSQYSLVALGS